jgi:hypothetical protein
MIEGASVGIVGEAGMRKKRDQEQRASDTLRIKGALG